jgi:hypothetical protein
MKGFERVINQSLIKNGGFINGKFSLGAINRGHFDVLNPANGNSLVQLPRMVVSHLEFRQLKLNVFQLIEITV